MTHTIKAVILVALAATTTGCVTATERGAVGGGLVGAGIGALSGEASGYPLEGALIGAALGGGAASIYEATRRR